MQAEQDDTPANQPAATRDELDQQNISKQGEARTAADAGPEPDSHFGAVEDTGESDQQLVTPPMDGPSNVTGDDDATGSLDVDPQDEIMGG